MKHLLLITTLLTLTSLSFGAETPHIFAGDVPGAITFPRIDFESFELPHIPTTAELSAARTAIQTMRDRVITLFQAERARIILIPGDPEPFQDFPLPDDHSIPPAELNHFMEAIFKLQQSPFHEDKSFVIQALKDCTKIPFFQEVFNKAIVALSILGEKDFATTKLFNCLSIEDSIRLLELIGKEDSIFELYIRRLHHPSSLSRYDLGLITQLRDLTPAQGYYNTEGQNARIIEVLSKRLFSSLHFNLKPTIRRLLDIIGMEKTLRVLEASLRHTTRLATENPHNEHYPNTVRIFSEQLELLREKKDRERLIHFRRAARH